jgi:hypothetical protein
MNTVSKFLLIIIMQVALMSSKISAQGFAVVELFTSQGCSSCPSADKLLAKLSNDTYKSQNNIYFLSMHVDYWNRLGWEDPFSSFKFTNRQRNYATVLKTKQVYTPQMVVNGSISFVGSDENKAVEAIEQQLKNDPGMSLSFTHELLNDTLLIHYTSSKATNNYYLCAALTADAIETKVKKGENAGKTLTSDHVVIEFLVVNGVDTAGTIKINAKKWQKAGESPAIVLFIQDKKSHRIHAATSDLLK